MTLGQRLTACREQRRLRQRDVADKLGLTNTQLSNYERDYREPNVERLIQLADFYGVTVQWLVTGREVDLGELLNKRDVRFYGVELSEEIRQEVIVFLKNKLGSQLTTPRN